MNFVLGSFTLGSMTVLHVSPTTTTPHLPGHPRSWHLLQGSKPEAHDIPMSPDQPLSLIPPFSNQLPKEENPLPSEILLF